MDNGAPFEVNAQAKLEALKIFAGEPSASAYCYTAAQESLTFVFTGSVTPSAPRWRWPGQILLQS